MHLSPRTSLCERHTKGGVNVLFPFTAVISSSVSNRGLQRGVAMLFHICKLLHEALFQHQNITSPIETSVIFLYVVCVVLSTGVDI